MSKALKIKDLEAKVAAIASHTIELHASSRSPLEHYRRGANDAWNLLLYFERNVEQAGAYPAVAEKHARRLNAMIIVMIVESFERYVKELAAVCVDHVAGLVFDDRIGSSFRDVPARTVGAHFAEKSVGRALTESKTWLTSREIHDTFRRILADEKNDLWQPGLFPAANDKRSRTLDTLFQVRHAIVHNVAVLTRSDAAKLQVLTGTQLAAPKLLWPGKTDVLVAKAFLDATAEWCDAQVESRLVAVLAALHALNPELFVPQAKADDLAKQFQRAITLLGATGTP